MKAPCDINNENVDARDEALFRSVYESFYHSLLNIACKYVEPEVARDIVQDTFLRLWNSPESYLWIDDLRLYLYRAVRNRSLNHIRDRRIEDKYRSGTDKVSEDFFCHAVQEEEVFVQMRKAIDGLPDIYRNVLTLSLDGMSDREVAERLGITTDNVKTRRKRGKSMLRDTLKNPALLLLLNLV